MREMSLRRAMATIGLAVALLGALPRPSRAQDQESRIDPLHAAFEAAAKAKRGDSADVFRMLAELERVAGPEARCVRDYLLAVVRRYPDDRTACDGVVLSAAAYPSAPKALVTPCRATPCFNVLEPKDMRALVVRIPADVVSVVLDVAKPLEIYRGPSTDPSAPAAQKLFLLDSECRLWIRTLTGEQAIIDRCEGSPIKPRQGVLDLGRWVTIRRAPALQRADLQLDGHLTLPQQDRVYLSGVDHEIADATDSDQRWELGALDSEVRIEADSQAPRRHWLSALLGFEGVLQKNSGVALLGGASLAPSRYLDVDVAGVLAVNTAGGRAGLTLHAPLSATIDAGAQLGGLALAPHGDKGGELARDVDLLWGGYAQLGLEVRTEFLEHRTRGFASFGYQRYATGSSRFVSSVIVLSLGARLGLL
jgi:hypothetical protein